MRVKIIGTIVIFILCISITGCMSNGSEVDTKDNGNINDNIIPKPTSIPSDNEPSIPDPTTHKVSFAMKAYRDVLNNKTEFYSIDHEKSLYLDDFLTDKEFYGTIYKPMRFTIIDMDGDKVPEVIIELMVGDYVEFYEILHYMNGEVYGNLRVLRGLMQLKTDATFAYSNGAADNGIAKLEFDSSGRINDTELGYSESSYGNGNIIISYFVNDEPVTEESYGFFREGQDKKQDTIWYGFTKENIETELNYNP